MDFAPHGAGSKAFEMLPLTLLRTAQGNPMLVELKNGDTYNGRLVNCDSWMNINLKVRQARVLMQAAAAAATVAATAAAASKRRGGDCGSAFQ